MHSYRGPPPPRSHHYAPLKPNPPGEKAFAAGADIKEMAPRDYIETYTGNMFADWANIQGVQTPVVAAVNGYAL